VNNDDKLLVRLFREDSVCNHVVQVICEDQLERDLLDVVQNYGDCDQRGV